MRTALTLLSLLGLCSNAAALEPDQLFRKISPSVWMVRTIDKSEVPTGSGSAVVVEPRRLITNCHVLKKANRILLLKGKTSVKARLELVDLERDLCLLAVEDSNFDAPVVERAGEKTLAIGQRVVTLGNPGALEMTLSDGLISRLQYDSDKRLEAIQTSAPFSPGSSGGGMFDIEGRLLGITQRVSIGTGVQNLNFALPVDWLDELPARSKQQLAEYYANKPAKK